MSDQKTGMPPIHTWWPYLTIDARHAVLIEPTHPLGIGVLVEIEQLTGAAVPPGSVLSDDDVQFVVAQIEPID